MDNQLKGKLDAAFDEGRLSELTPELRSLVGSDPEALAYVSRLEAISSGLGSISEAPAVEVPAGFTRTVLSRLPATRTKPLKSNYLRDIFLVIYFALIAIGCFIFRDALGITALFNMLSSKLGAGGEISTEIVFSVFTSIGILAVTWLIITSFFGIRSRRITR